MSEPTVEVKERSRRYRPRPTDIPEELILYFRSKGRHLRLGWKDDTARAVDNAMGFDDVAIQQIPNDLKPLAKARFKLKEGFLFKGDLILQSRSHRERDEINAEQNERKMALEGDWEEAVTSNLDDLARSTGKSAGGITMIDAPPLRDQVVGGEAAVRAGLVAQEVLDAVTKRKGE